MRTYTVEVTREGDAWLADVDGVPGAHTYARNLANLDKELDDVIRLMDDLSDQAHVSKTLRFINISPEQAQAVRLREIREDLIDRERRLLVATVLTAQHLIESGSSVRDIAGLLGLTHGRISQMADLPIEPDAAAVRNALIEDWRERQEEVRQLAVSP